LVSNGNRRIWKETLSRRCPELSWVKCILHW
jgi:hypothetical protein